ncbi:MAG: hypothetical protein ACREMQ_18065 [Longimicrobiales bacterium]
MRAVRSFIRILDRQTLIILLLSQAATYLCFRAGLGVQLPEAFIAIAIVFPLGFSINAAYMRREKALESYATLKALAVSCYYAHRDWLDAEHAHVVNKVGDATHRLFEAISRLLANPTLSAAELNRVYGCFSEISATNEELRLGGVHPSDVKKLHQYVSLMMLEFERIRNVRFYRTPASIRAYGQVFLNLLPILFAPHFAYMSQTRLPAIGFGMAGLYSLILVSLDNIQEALENPFDQFGEDDIILDGAAHYLAATRRVEPAQAGALPTSGRGAYGAPVLAFADGPPANAESPTGGGGNVTP